MARRTLSLLFIVFLLSGTAAFANTAPAANREEVRKKLESFFAHMDEKSPDALRNISKSPEALKQIDKRIESMSDTEVAEFQKLMTDVPDWQMAPQAIAKMLPADAMKTIDKTSADFTKRAPQAEKTRSDIATLATVLRMLPDAKLKELGVTREMLDSLDGAMNQISPLQAGMLEQQASKSAGFKEKSDAAMAALPPALQKGAAALAKHGPLSALDKADLETFRSQLIAAFDAVQSLPDAAKKELKLEDIGTQVTEMHRATPEMLFMVREQMPDDMMSKLSANVALMQKIANMTDDDRKTLDRFRTDLEDVFARGEHAADNKQKIEALSAADLVVLQQGLPDIDAWKQDKSGFLNALNDPNLGQRITALQQSTPDPSLVASLEQYRVDTLSAIDSAKGSVDPKLATSARDVVAKASLPSLELLRTVQSNSPHMAPEALVKAANDIGTINLDCRLSLGSLDLGALGSFSLGSIDFNFICKPIQDAINAIDGAINTAVNAVSDTVTNVINTVRDFLNNAISSAQNFLKGVIDAVGSTVSSIWSFVQTIPSLAWNAIKTAFNAILNLPLPGTNGLTLGMIINGSVQQIVPALQSALNLGEGFWNSMNGVLPQIPCPPAGFSTPFGTVGSDDAAAKYNHYQFFLDKIFGLIPSDVFSLEVKIPAQVLYAAWQYLGLCLQEAAQAADAAAADKLAGDRFTAITLGLTNLGNQSNGNTLSLTNTVNSDFTSLTNLDTKNALDAKNLALRMAIELDLQAGDPSALAMFQLPHANGGYLDVVQQIVNDDINATLATGQTVGQAQKFFSDALTAMSQGKFKLAFKNFQKAYQEITKQ